MQGSVVEHTGLIIQRTGATPAIATTGRWKEEILAGFGASVEELKNKAHNGSEWLSLPTISIRVSSGQIGFTADQLWKRH